MRLPEAFWEWWQQMIPTPEPQETPAPTAWDVTQDFVRTAKKVDQLRR